MKQVLSFLLFATALFAPISATWAGAPFDWQDPSFVECQQDCLYNHGNEVVSLQGRYLLEKVTYLKNPAFSADEKRQNLGVFCLSGESDQGCIDRFVRIAVRQLYSVKNSIVKNDDSVASLMSRGAPVHGNFALKPVAPVATSGVPVMASRGQVPYVPSYDDLKQDAADLVKLHYLSSDQYVSWVDKTAEAMPSLTDFPKWTKVKKDPTDPTSDDMIVFQTDPSGRILYDQDAYALALANWNKRRQSMDKDLGQMRANSKVEAERSNQALEQFAQAKSSDPVVKNSDRDLFNQARGPFVNEANAMMKEKGLMPETGPVKLNQPVPATASAQKGTASSPVAAQQGSSVFSNKPALGRSIFDKKPDQAEPADRKLASSSEKKNDHEFQAGSFGTSAFRPSTSFVQHLTTTNPQAAPQDRAPAQAPAQTYTGEEKVGVPIPSAPQPGMTSVDQISVQAPLEDFETRRIEDLNP